MEKLDKVVAGLDSCTDCDCQNCNYNGRKCTNRLLMDALQWLERLQRVREDYEIGLILNAELPEMLWGEGAKE